jgi:hypothetical protein
MVAATAHHRATPPGFWHEVVSGGSMITEFVDQEVTFSVNNSVLRRMRAIFCSDA